MKQFVSIVFVVISAISVSAQSATKLQDSPKAVVEELLELARSGQLQTPGGWKQANGVFAHSTPMPDTHSAAIIGEDYTVQEMWTKGSHAEVVVKYRSLGRIDSSLRYNSPAQWIPKVERRYQLVRAGATNSGWRIQNPPAELLIGSNAAIQYVTRMRESANSPVLNKNAEATLQKLKTLH